MTKRIAKKILNESKVSQAQILEARRIIGRVCRMYQAKWRANLMKWEPANVTAKGRELYCPDINSMYR